MCICKLSKEGTSILDWDIVIWVLPRWDKHRCNWQRPGLLPLPLLLVVRFRKHQLLGVVFIANEKWLGMGHSQRDGQTDLEFMVFAVATRRFDDNDGDIWQWYVFVFLHSRITWCQYTIHWFTSSSLIMEFWHISIHWNSHKIATSQWIYDIFYAFLFWGLPYSFDLAKVSSTVVMWLPSRRCCNLTNWWVLLEWTSTRWICIEVIVWDSREYKGPKATIIVGKIPKGLLFEVLVMRVMKVTNLRAYYAGIKAMRFVKVWHVTLFWGGEWLKEWAKQLDQMLLITRQLKNWNGILHVSTKDGKSFWKDWMIIL